MSLGLLLGKIENQGELWEVMLKDVEAFIERSKASNQPSRNLELVGTYGLFSPLAADQVGDELRTLFGAHSLARIEVLGRRIGEMHVHFGKATGLEKEPVALDERYWENAKAGLLARVAEEKLLTQEDEPKQNLSSIHAALTDLTFPLLPKGAIRVHGDLHLGQVLLSNEDVVLIDFEGEPLHSLAYRRRRHCAFKDVAGMIRSLHYAPYAVALQTYGGEQWASLAAAKWFSIASRIFLTAYLRATMGSGFVSTNEVDNKQMLAFYLADKVLYEIAYERASRPDWLKIPLAGLEDVKRLLSEN